MDIESGLLNFSIDGWSLLAAFIFGVIGLWVFREGRKRENNSVKYIGVALMIYPYFVEGRFWNWSVGTALCLAAYFFW